MNGPANVHRSLRCLELVRREYQIRQRINPKVKAPWKPARKQLEMVVQHRADEARMVQEFLVQKRARERELQQRTAAAEAEKKQIESDISTLDVQIAAARMAAA